MKLLCVVTYVSLFLHLVQCARLVHFNEEAQNNYGALSKIENPIHRDSTRKDCCHLPKDKQNCTCCLNACIQQRRSPPRQRSCCYLPKPLQNCQCCPKACAHAETPPLEDCCHLSKRALSCRCCPLACVPPPLVPLTQAVIIQLSQQPSGSQELIPQNCCSLFKPFQNCQCCPSACQLPTPMPFNEICCHWPQSLQNCVCCVPSCQITPTVSAPSNDKKNPTLEVLSNYKKGVAESTEATTEATLVFTTSDCCHFPKEFQNCNCCPSLCQETTTSPEEPTTLSTDDCCDQPEDQQNCGCCPDACDKQDSDEPSALITITMKGKVPRGTGNEFGYCNLPKEFRRCKCCSAYCCTRAGLLHYVNCCNWSKRLRCCVCCPQACQRLAPTITSYNSRNKLDPSNPRTLTSSHRKNCKDNAFSKTEIPYMGYKNYVYDYYFNHAKDNESNLRKSNKLADNILPLRNLYISNKNYGIPHRTLPNLSFGYSSVDNSLVDLKDMTGADKSSSYIGLNPHSSDSVGNLMTVNKKYSNIHKTLNFIRNQPTKKVLFNNDHANNRYPPYYPVDLAAPVHNLKQLRICDSKLMEKYIMRYPFDVQQLCNSNQEVVSPPRALFFDTSDYYDYSYVVDEYYDNDIVDDEGDIELIPLKYSQRPFLSITEPNDYKFHPWNDSIYQTELINMNLVNTVPQRADDLEPYNEFNDDLMKFYAIAHKSEHNSDILDGLAKIATGFEANHGELEFDPKEDYSARLLRYLHPTAQVSHHHNVDNILGRITKNSSSKSPHRHDFGIIPWLNIHGVTARKNDYYYTNSSVRYLNRQNPLDNARTMDNVEHLYAGSDAGDYIYQEPNWRFWNNDDVGSNANEGLDLIEKSLDYNPTDSTTETKENPIPQNGEKSIGLSSVGENLSPIRKFQEEAAVNRHKRDVKFFKWRNPNEVFWLTQFRPLHTNVRQDERHLRDMMNYRRDSLQVHDPILAQMFHTLKSLRSNPSARKMQVVSRSYNANKNKQKKIIDSFGRKLWYPSRLFQNALDTKSDNQENSGLNVWPIAYSTNNTKELEMSIPTPASSAKEVNEAGASSTYSIERSKTKQKSTAKEPLSLVVISSHSVPLAPFPVGDVSIPTDSFNIRICDNDETIQQQGILYCLVRKSAEEDARNNFNQEHRSLNHVDLKPLKEGEDKEYYDIKKRIFVPSVLSRAALTSTKDDLQAYVKTERNSLKSGLLNLNSVNKNVKNKLTLQHPASSHVTRISVEEDVRGSPNAKRISLKPYRLYRINLNPVDDNKKKIVTESHVLSRVARNYAEEDGIKDIVTGLEEPFSFKNSTEVKSVNNLQVGR